MKLRCSNPDCDSHKREQYLFHAVIAFDEDRELAENPRKIEPDGFTCCECGQPAVEVSNGCAAR
jgi:hypothetical protein